MPSWVISENESDNSFEILSGLGEIINLTESPLSLRKIGILAIKSLILKSTCQTCAIVLLETQIPEGLHDDIMKHVPGEFLVSIYNYFTTMCTVRNLCTVRSCPSLQTVSCYLKQGNCQSTVVMYYLPIQ